MCPEFCILHFAVKDMQNRRQLNGQKPGTKPGFAFQPDKSGFLFVFVDFFEIGVNNIVLISASISSVFATFFSLC